MKKLISILISLLVFTFISNLFICDNKPPKIDDGVQFFYSSDSDPEWEVYPDSVAIKPAKVSSSFLVRGNCVDKAICIINILKRQEVFDDTFYAAIGDGGFTGHVQIIKLDENENVKYLVLTDFFNVEYGNSEFVSDPPAFYDIDTFLEIAAKEKVLTMQEIRNYAAKKNVSKNKKDKT